MMAQEISSGSEQSTFSVSYLYHARFRCWKYSPRPQKVMNREADSALSWLQVRLYSSGINLFADGLMVNRIYRHHLGQR